jgi:hypothetical protein
MGGIAPPTHLFGGTMAKRVWQCDSCKKANEQEPWECPGCGNETCDSCFDRYAHCRACSMNKRDEDLRLAANAAGYDFEA